MDTACLPENSSPEHSFSPSKEMLMLLVMLLVDTGSHARAVTIPGSPADLIQEGSANSEPPSSFAGFQTPF
jgi:hypothetical protein